MLLIGNTGKLRRIEIMTDVITTAITAAIDANCDEDNAARLCRCLPMLLEAIEDWRSGAAVGATGQRGDGSQHAQRRDCVSRR